MKNIHLLYSYGITLSCDCQQIFIKIIKYINVNRSLYVTIGTSSLLSKSPAADVAPFGSLGKVIIFDFLCVFEYNILNKRVVDWRTPSRRRRILTKVAFQLGRQGTLLFAYMNNKSYDRAKHSYERK